MTRSLVIFWRGFVLLAFLVVMPLLALPPVGKWYDAWLLGEPPKTTSPPAAEPPHSPVDSESTQSSTPADEPPALAITTSRAGAPQPPATENLPANSAERFESIPQRLKQLGAEYLRLESVDTEGRQFRFHCRMPLGGSAAYSRPFEVTATDPVEAMQRVLTEVEAWQAARDLTPETRAETRSAARPKLLATPR